MKRRPFIKAAAIPSLSLLSDTGRASDAPTLSRGTIRESAREIPVLYETDICVLGGSPTGVFAAVRAARLGARVVIVEKKNHFGGAAAITCTWHSLMDTEYRRQIIEGLTQEVTERLQQRSAINHVKHSGSKGFEFRPGELKVVLDELITDVSVKPYLHTVFCARWSKTEISPPCWSRTNRAAVPFGPASSWMPRATVTCVRAWDCHPFSMPVCYRPPPVPSSPIGRHCRGCRWAS